MSGTGKGSGSSDWVVTGNESTLSFEVNRSREVIERRCACADCANGRPPRNPASPTPEDQREMALHWRHMERITQFERVVPHRFPVPSAPSSDGSSESASSAFRRSIGLPVHSPSAGQANRQAWKCWQCQTIPGESDARFCRLCGGRLTEGGVRPIRETIESLRLSAEPSGTGFVPIDSVADTRPRDSPDDVVPVGHNSRHSPGQAAASSSQASGGQVYERPQRSPWLIRERGFKGLKRWDHPVEHNCHYRHLAGRSAFEVVTENEYCWYSFVARYLRLDFKSHAWGMYGNWLKHVRSGQRLSPIDWRPKKI